MSHHRDHRALFRRVRVAGPAVQGLVVEDGNGAGGRGHAELVLAAVAAVEAQLLAGAHLGRAHLGRDVGERQSDDLIRA